MTTINLKQIGLLGDFRLLVILFIAFRVMMLMVYQPLLIDDVERGVGAQGDRIVSLSIGRIDQRSDNILFLIGGASFRLYGMASPQPFINRKAKR